MKYPNCPEVSILPGDVVRFTNEKAHEVGPDYFPAAGTIGNVFTVYCLSKTAVVRWPDGAIKGSESDVPHEWLAFVSREDAP